MFGGTGVVPSRTNSLGLVPSCGITLGRGIVFVVVCRSTAHNYMRWRRQILFPAGRPARGIMAVSSVCGATSRRVDLAALCLLPLLVAATKASSPPTPSPLPLPRWNLPQPDASRPLGGLAPLEGASHATVFTSTPGMGTYNHGVLQQTLITHPQCAS